MTIKLEKSGQALGAIVSGVDLRNPISSVTAAEIERELERHGVLIFHDQPLSDDELTAFTANFGKMQIAYSAESGANKGWKRRIARPDVFDISNLDENGDPLKPDDDRKIFNRFNATWHADTTFKPMPTKIAFLLARELPPAGGNTQFADMRLAYEDLPAELQKKIDPLVAVHSQFYSRGKLGYTNFTDEERAKWPPVLHPLVRTQQSTGRKNLYLCSHVSHIDGMPEEEGRSLVQQLTEHATQTKYIFEQKWAVSDLLIWDNRITMHRAMPYEDEKYRRVLVRQGIDEETRPLDQLKVAA